MASTSASSVQMVFKNDVFLSFRGEDTRGNFVDHLYDALIRKGIITYKDDETIEKGERISDQLVRSIEESRFYIIVFSKNYSDSSWCLDELVKIMECQKTKEQTAYPVFYHVEPTEIRNLKGEFGEGFQKNAGKEAAGKWRGALKEACDLAGWHLKPDGREAKVIQEIVTCISVKLHVINMSVDKNLVGMEEQVKDVVSSLAIDSEDDVRMVGIKGIGGGGKTTLARAVFDNISIFFDGISFVEDVKSSKGSGLKELQKQILASVLNDKSINVTGVYDGINKMKKMMPSTKALVVLDDVDDMNQLEALAGDLTWFKPGSRVIITTRDEQVLKSHQVKLSVIHDAKYVIHDIQLLRDDAAICLLSRHAFGREIPNQGYEELSRKVVDYAAGLPLAIKVLGSSLCDGTLSEWESFIQRLKRIPSKGILEILELSYDGLEDDQKQIFLDVACLLKGKSKIKAVRILESCGLDAEFGLKVLEQKSLITIPRKPRFTSVFDDDDYFYYNYFGLHDLIEEMGKDIVRRVARDEPSRHNRLWIKEEIEDILHNELGTEATRSIKLEYSYLHPATIMKGLKKMNNLRFLYVNASRGEIDEVDQYLPNTLRSLHWFRYPFWCLPKTFKANMLVNLEMPYSNISQLWEGEEKKVLERLRFVDLRNSKLIIFDLGLIPNIESLDLRECKHLVELQTTAELPEIKYLNRSYSKVSKLNLGLIPNIKELYLQGCEDLVELQMTVELSKLSYLNCSHSKVSMLNLELIPNIEELYLKGCKDLVELQITAELPELKYLNLSYSKVSKLNLVLIPNIEKLYLEKCEDLVELQMTVELPKLYYLNLTHSKVSKLNLGLIPNIMTLNLKGCEDLVEIQMTVELPKLNYLDLSHSKVSKLNLGLIPNIEMLNLNGCEDLVELQMTIELPKLEFLDLSHSKVSKLNLGLIPNIEELYLKGCEDLVELQMIVELPKLNDLDLSHSKVSKLELELIPNIKRLDLKQCENLVELQMTVELPKLIYLNFSHSKVSKLNLGLIPNIEELYLKGCEDLLELQMTIELPKLKYLDLSHSKVSKLHLGLIPVIETEDLVELQMTIELPKLKYLNLSHSKVSKLHLGLIPNIEKLYLIGCEDLLELHMHVELLKLKDLKLSSYKMSKFNKGLTPHLEIINDERCRCLHERQANIFSYKQFELSGIDTLNMKKSIAKSLDVCPKHPKNILSYSQLHCFYDESLPSLSENLEKLISLGLCACTCLESFSASICSLQHLKVFTLKGSIPEVFKLGQLESLEKLSLSLEDIKHIPDSICMMKHLKSLELKSCWFLEKLPMDLGRLECLEELHLTDCVSLQDIPNSICEIKCLKYLDLSFCFQVKKLPEELGRVECLKVLNIECADISRLPETISQLKDLRIIGQTWQLESYGFTSLTENSTNTSSCYVGNYFDLNF